MFAAPPRRKALRALSGKARMLRRREHGTPDHRPCRPASAEQPSVQFPAGIERKRALYGVPTKRQGCFLAAQGAPAATARLDTADVAVSEGATALRGGHVLSFRLF